jgi:hypothetical protein
MQVAFPQTDSVPTDRERFPRTDCVPTYNVFTDGVYTDSVPTDRLCSQR